MNDENLIRSCGIFVPNTYIYLHSFLLTR